MDDVTRLQQRMDDLFKQIAEEAKVNASHYSELKTLMSVLTMEVAKLRAASELLVAKGCPGFCQTEIDQLKDTAQNTELRLGKLERWAHPPQTRGKRLVIDVGKIGGGLLSWEVLRALFRYFKEAI